MKRQNSKHQTQNTKNTAGITLIALIITIVVLLILAIVSINLAMNGGIITHTEDAVEKYEIEEEKEKVTLAVSEAYMSGLGKITEENLESALDTNIGAGKYSIDSSNSEYFKVTITESGREYRVYLNGKVEGPTLGTGGEVVTPPEEGGENPPQTEMPVATVGIKVEENSTINGELYSSTNPIIPAGFTAINVTIEGQESSWDAESGPEVDNGLVIRDESGNEFVWVPVTEDISTTEYNVDINGYFYKEPYTTSYTHDYYDAVLENLQRAECTENPDDSDEVLTLNDFSVELKKLYKSMAESINKYDGFYVGRFETSKNGTDPQSKRSPGTIYDENYIVTAYGSSIENDWYELYALNKRYKTTSAQGSMMWGIQYDKMVSWMGSAAETTISGYNKDRTCGTASDDVIKNVYDIYGNSIEWTLERSLSNDRVYRGGARMPSGRGSTLPTENVEYGSRIALYIL